MSNVVNLSDYRQEKEGYKQSPPQYIKEFEVGGYYVYPELGVMIHCMLITDGAHSHNNELMFIMEDHHGNIFSVPINDPEGMMGWQVIDEEIFVETIKKSSSEPDPPKVS